MPIKNEEAWAATPREKIEALKDKAKTLFNHEAAQPGAVHKTTLIELIEHAEDLGLVRRDGMARSGMLHASDTRLDTPSYQNGSKNGWRANQALGHIHNRASRALRILDAPANCYKAPERIMYVGYPEVKGVLGSLMRA